MKILEKYELDVDETFVKQSVKDIITNNVEIYSKEILSQIFSFIDLTTLNITDTSKTVEDMTLKVNRLKDFFPKMTNVASICVYPTLVSVVKKHLTEKNVGITSVAAGFPASQTFTDIKILECKKAVQEGATEIDTVISVRKLFEGDYQKVFDEIRAEKESVGNAHLKVILETGSLRSYREIRVASLLAIEAGADFIKTSTGKITPAATPEAVFIMCQAIKDYYAITNRKIGIKPAGGISTPAEAFIYYRIVKEVLGNKWLDNRYFRIGASKLANNILTEIARIDNAETQMINYF